GRYERSELGGFVAGVAHTDAAGRPGQGVDQVVVDGRSGDDAASGGAVLPGVHEPGQFHPLDDGVEVGVVEDEDGGLAPELQVDPLQRPAGGLGDGVAR